jgi:hypothetical protein
MRSLRELMAIFEQWLYQRHYSTQRARQNFFTALQIFQNKTINVLKKEEEPATKHELPEMQATYPISEAVL